MRLNSDLTPQACWFPIGLQRHVGLRWEYWSLIRHVGLQWGMLVSDVSLIRHVGLQLACRSQMTLL